MGREQSLLNRTNEGTAVRRAVILAAGEGRRLIVDVLCIEFSSAGSGGH